MIRPRGYISPWYIAIVVIVVIVALIIAFSGSGDQDARITTTLSCQEINDITLSEQSIRQDTLSIFSHISQIDGSRIPSSQITEDTLVVDLAQSQNSQEYLFACLQAYFETDQNTMNDLWGELIPLVFVYEWIEYLESNN